MSSSRHVQPVPPINPIEGCSLVNCHFIPWYPRAYLRERELNNCYSSSAAAKLNKALSDIILLKGGPARFSICSANFTGMLYLHEEETERQTYICLSYLHHYKGHTSLNNTRYNHGKFHVGILKVCASWRSQLVPWVKVVDLALCIVSQLL